MVSHLDYRPEVDGLRAVAIVPVVFYHAGVPGFSGGLLGVDVFFVVSGYLITRMLAGELINVGRINFADFYERRARRIVPALIPVLAFCAAAAWAVMNAEDFRHFARSLGAAALFGSNVWFALRSTYFGTDEAILPLLHTWSLGVEEQYYLVFPIMLALCWRWLGRRAVLAAIVVIALLSFGLMIWLAFRQPAWAFFLLPARLWELLVGGACALIPACRRANAPLTSGGLILIALGFYAGAGIQTVGVHLLLPVAGTALVLLAADQGSLPGRGLAWRPLVLIGLSSYGTYLWHLPLIGFVRYVWFGPFAPIVTGGIILLCFALGWLSFRLVERPVRIRRKLGSRRSIAAFGIAALGSFALLAGAASQERFAPRQGGFEEAFHSRFPGEDVDRTVVAGGSEPLDFVLYGDSHARQYFPALSAKLGRGALISDDGCLSLPGLSSIDPDNIDPCRNQFEALRQLLAEQPARVVILAHIWNRDAWRIPAKTGAERLLPAGGEVFEEAVVNAIRAIPAESTVVVLGHVPAARPPLQPQMARGYTRCLAYMNVRCPTAIPRAEGEGVEINRVLARAAARSGRAIFVDPADALCTQTRCAILDRDILLYSDESHVSNEGAGRVAAHLVHTLAKTRPLAIAPARP